MSNTPLDDISYKLGEVSACLESLASTLAKHDQKLTDLGTSVGEIKTRLKPVTDDIKWMKPQVQSYQKVRKSALWVGSAAVTVLGAGAGFISDWAVKKYFG
jgi:hypothetical protein